MMNRRGLLIVAAALACSAALPVATTHASCIDPPVVSLLWSYPADGDQDVPTNAVFWAVATWPQPKVTLDDVALPQPASSSDELSLGTLLPNHDYTLHLVYDNGDTDYTAPDAGSPPAFFIKFRTGDGPATRVPEAPIDAVQRSADRSTSTCLDIVNAGECFDTGQDVLLTFDVSSPNAIGWLVHGKPWPARCGKPATYAYDSFAPGHCPQVAPIGPGGLLGPTQSYCPVATTNKTADDGSCSASARSSRGGSGTALLLSLASLVLARRKKA